MILTTRRTIIRTIRSTVIMGARTTESEPCLNAQPVG